MPEYLSPGVYIDETSYRTKTIEGVSTSTAGFIGPTRFGPVSGEPELITSLADFIRIYGDLEDLNFDGLPNPQANYLAHGVRAFFEEGGRRLFVQRVFNAPAGFAFDANTDIPTNHYATWEETTGGATPTTEFTLVARFPGRAGNMRIRFELKVGDNIYRENTDGGNHFLSRLSNNSLVHVRDSSPATTHNVAAGEDFATIATNLSAGGFTITADELAAANGMAATDPLTAGDVLNVPELYSALGSQNGLMVARRDTATGAWELYDTDPDDGNPAAAIDLDAAATPAAGLQVRPVSLLVEAATPALLPGTFGPFRTIGEYSLVETARNALLSTFTANPENRFEALTIPFAIFPATDDHRFSITLLTALMGADVIDSLSAVTEERVTHYTLEDGGDGALPMMGNYEGDPTFVDLTGDVIQMELNGLVAFEAVEDISIVASPGYTADRDEAQALAIQNALIGHCEAMWYRVAVLDTPENQTVTEALNFRNLTSTTHAALYYPWINVIDPRVSRNGQLLKLPPSGFIAGIYARNDIENAVFKAPANEVVRLATNFEVKLTQAHQDILNPNGVNCLRFFEGRGYLVWGARTISDDPEWKYISLRRYFAYLERSIDRSTQWVVFENNGPQLWARVRRMVEDFLENEWVSGGLLGNKPEQAFFVRCDRSTMTQNDLDNGRLVCQVGIAPVRPAEFVIFEIGQWTGDAATTGG